MHVTKLESPVVNSLPDSKNVSVSISSSFHNLQSKVSSGSPKYGAGHGCTVVVVSSVVVSIEHSEPLKV